MVVNTGVRIDCRMDPAVPDGGWWIYKHMGIPEVLWDTTRVERWRSELQKSHPHDKEEPAIPGNEIYERVEQDNGLVNAALLDYLLEHQELIPGDWKDSKTYFWGTLYQHPLGTIGVRFMTFDEGRQRFISSIRRMSDELGKHDWALLVYDYPLPAK